MHVQGFSQPYVYQDWFMVEQERDGLREGMRILQDPHLPP